MKRPLALEHLSLSILLVPTPNKGRNDLGAQRRGTHPTQPPCAPSSSVKSRETGTIWSKQTSSPVMAILRCVYRKRLRAGSRGEDRARRPAGRMDL